MSATTIPLLSLSVAPTADTKKHIFIEVDGSLPTANGAALGTTQRGAKKGEQVAIIQVRAFTKK